MLKTIKGKVIAGTVTLALVAGAGSAFAASNAGANLLAWYNGQYNTSVQSVSDQSYDYVNSKVDGLVNEYNGLKTNATTNINGTRDSSTTRANNMITAEKQEHINAINRQKTQISGYMASQFDGLSTFANGLIVQAGLDATAYAQVNLGAHATTEGGNAVAKVSTDVSAASAAAVTELETAISNAQGELNAKLAVETTATVDEIKGMVDAKIVELRGTITIINNNLIATQKGLINAEAGRQLQSAKDALQDVVDGI